MSEELARIVSDHGQRMRMLENQAIKNSEQNDRHTEQFGALLGELHTVAEKITESTLAFREYAVKHDNLKESNDKLWEKVEKQDASIGAINLTLAENKKIASVVERQGVILEKIATTNATNQVALDSFTMIKNRALVLVVAAILSPITLGAALIFTK